MAHASRLARSFRGGESTVALARRWKYYIIVSSSREKRLTFIARMVRWNVERLKLKVGDLKYKNLNTQEQLKS